jgi:hypothetical protein
LYLFIIIAVANRWGGTSSLLPLIVPIDAAMLAGAGRSAATAAVANVSIAADTTYIIAGADNALML